MDRRFLFKMLLYKPDMGAHAYDPSTREKKRRVGDVEANLDNKRSCLKTNNNRF